VITAVQSSELNWALRGIGRGRDRHPQQYVMLKCGECGLFLDFHGPIGALTLILVQSLAILSHPGLLDWDQSWAR
jgi:hypothetical protein